MGDYIDIVEQHPLFIVFALRMPWVFLKLFEDLVEKHFKNIKSPTAYAGLMKISERHLNRVTRACLSKTASEFILDRCILEAKRLLMRGEMAIADVSLMLGYIDNSYFSQIFKKRTGKTPREFMGTYR